MSNRVTIPLLLAAAWTFGTSAPRGLAADAAAGPGLVPWPASVKVEAGEMALTGQSRVVAGSADLLPLAGVVCEEVRAAAGVELKAAEGTPRAGDIVLGKSSELKGEAYTVRVGDQAVVEGADYAAVAMGTTTLLQLLRAGPAAPAASAAAALPHATIADAPLSRYRGLLIDVARSYHSLDTLRQCVSLCRLYKVRFLQLHLTDDPAFTFPSTAFPKLSAQPQHGGPAYTLEELRGLERFARERGVTIVPEMEVPGHAGAMNRAMPELFKIKGTKPYEHHASINFANPAVLQAVDTLVGEICDVFASSPYFHIGGDEADLAFAHQHPDFQAAFKQFGLGEKGQGQLYRHFLIQMDEIVRKHGKQMIVWEGFHRDPKSQFQIPKDVIVMEYECPFYPPEQLVADGFTVVNAAWTPLYVVNRHRWLPRRIYEWDLWLFGQVASSYPRVAWHRVKPTDQVVGAQLCAWEQREAVEIASLRTRLPAMAERIWDPAGKLEYADFARRARAGDELLSRLIPTVRFQADGLAVADPNAFDCPVFHQTLKLAMRSELPAAEIRYTLDGSAPYASHVVEDAAAGGAGKPAPTGPRRGGNCMTYAEPIVLTKTTTVRAGAFDAAGRCVGHPGGEVFYYDKPPASQAPASVPAGGSAGARGQ
jgi:hexosaminidase